MKRVTYIIGAPLAAALVIILLQSCRRTPRETTGATQLRIVSLAPSVTEILFALDAGDCVVGVTSSCDYPPAVKQIECVGGFGSPSMEKLLSLSPDLVIATGAKHRDAQALLDSSGVKMFWVDTDGFSEMFAAFRHIGREVGKPQLADELVAGMKTELAQVAEQLRTVPDAQRLRVFVELWNDPMTTAGNGSHVDEVITMAARYNVAHEIDSAYPIVNPEKVIQWNPDVIVLGYMNREAAPAALANRIGWSDIAAVQSGEIISDIPSEIFLRSGPRLVEGVKALHQRLYNTKRKEARQR